MANNPYNVKITADETHSVNRREFVVFYQMKNKSILHFQNIEISVFTYLLTLWGRVLLEKLTGFAASREIPHI
jgi:hypothetical protein